MPVIANVAEIVTSANDQVGTRGCDPCVALVAIYANERKCAHFSVNFSGPFTQARIDQALLPILQNNFPIEGIVAVGYTWGGGGQGMGAAQICVMLAAYFQAANPTVGNLQDSAISTANNTVAFSNLETWPFTNDPALNQNADLTLPAVATN